MAILDTFLGAGGAYVLDTQAIIAAVQAANKIFSKNAGVYTAIHGVYVKKAGVYVQATGSVKASGAYVVVSPPVP